MSCAQGKESFKARSLKLSLCYYQCRWVSGCPEDPQETSGICQPAETTAVRKPWQLPSQDWWVWTWDHSRKTSPVTPLAIREGTPKQVRSEAHPTLNTKSLWTTVHGHSSPTFHGVCTLRGGHAWRPSVPQAQLAGAGAAWVLLPPRGALRCCLTFTGGLEKVAKS